MEVPVTATTTLARALAVLAAPGLSELYWSGRATLVNRPEDFAAFDDAFAATLADSPPPTGPEPPSEGPESVTESTRSARVAEPTRFDDDDDDDPDPSDGDQVSLRWSADDVLRLVDFAQLDVGDLDRLLATLPIRRSLRQSRRRRVHNGDRGPLHMRRTASRAVRDQGEILHLVRTQRRPAPRRLVVLVDVSGSMEPYAAALLRLAHRFRAGSRRVEVFTIGTRLTRLTNALDHRDVAVAMHDAARLIPDWSGGTRLGKTLQRFNDEWGCAGAARGATVVVLSDGWDRGEPEILGEEMARLARVAHRIIWVNPLKATADYAPLAGGMAAALPHVDDFVAGNTVEALDEVLEAIAR